jgi:hypothetical protein
MRRAMAVALMCAALAGSAWAVRQIVQLSTPFVARKVDGVVLDPSGAPIADLTVTDLRENWGKVIRTTKTDGQGRFHFSAQSGKALYWLRFDHPEFNPLELKLKLNSKAPHLGITAKPHIGG